MLLPETMSLPTGRNIPAGELCRINLK